MSKCIHIISLDTTLFFRHFRPAAFSPGFQKEPSSVVRGAIVGSLSSWHQATHGDLPGYEDVEWNMMRFKSNPT